MRKFFNCGKYLLFLLFFIALYLPVSYPGEALESNVAEGDKQLSELLTDAEKDEGEEKIVKGVSKIRMPFIANKGQIENESVKFYARTFGGTVYVTKNGELVYSLPEFEGEVNNKAEVKHKDKTSLPAITRGWSLKERHS